MTRIELEESILETFGPPSQSEEAGLEQLLLTLEAEAGVVVARDQYLSICQQVLSGSQEPRDPLDAAQERLKLAKMQMEAAMARKDADSVRVAAADLLDATRELKALTEAPNGEASAGDSGTMR